MARAGFGRLEGVAMAAYGITATFETSQTLPLPSAYNHCHLFIDLPARLPTYHFMTKYVYFLHLREHRPLITVLLGILVVLSLSVHVVILIREAAKKKPVFFGRSLPNVGGWGG